MEIAWSLNGKLKIENRKKRAATSAAIFTFQFPDFNFAAEAVNGTEGRARTADPQIHNLVL
jgi:hypothetical protein